MENPQMAMPAEMAAQGPSPEEMAIYDQMRQQISPQEFSNEMLASASQVDPQAVAEFTQELQGLDVSPEELDALNDLVDQILANPEQYDQLRQQFLAQGMPDDILPEQFDPYFFAALNMAVDQLIAAPAGVQAFAEGGIAELKPIAKAIASYGRNGDTMLAHITPAEARMLKRRGGSGTINPATGLPEFFLKKAFKSIGKAVKKFASSTVGRIVTTVALGFFLGPAAASALGVSSAAGVAAVSGFIGGAGSTLLAGGNLRDALKAGAIGGVTAGAVGGVTQGFNTAYTGPTTIAGQVDAFRGMLPGGTPPVPTGEVPGMAPTAPPVDPSDFSALPETPGGAPVPKKVGIDLAGNRVNPSGPPTGAPPPVADPLGDFIQQNEAARAAANAPAGGPPSLVDQTKQFYKENISPTGIREAATPGAQRAGEKAVSDLLARVPTATPAMQETAFQTAFKAAMPGVMATYGPMAGVGLGIMGLTGGFESKSGPGITPADRKGPTERIREEGSQKKYFVQGMPGVRYDQFGEPIYGESNPFTTQDPAFALPTTIGGIQGVMPPMAVYNTPSSSFGSRQVAQPYNTASMYTNLMGPQRYADGGEITPVANVATTTAADAAAADRAAAAQAAKDAADRATRAAQRVAADQGRQMRRAAGSGTMYANINAGLSALAPEFNPMNVADTGFGARNRASQLAALNQTYAPMLQGQRNAMAEQARIMGVPTQAPVGIGALPAGYDQAYVDQLVREAAQQAGGTLSLADASNAAKNLGIPVSMLTSPLITRPPTTTTTTTTAPKMPATYDQAYVDQLVREAAQQAGGTLSYADAANTARNLGIPLSMLTSPLITGAPTSAASAASAGAPARNTVVQGAYGPNSTAAALGASHIADGVQLIPGAPGYDPNKAAMRLAEISTYGGSAGSSAGDTLRANNLYNTGMSQWQTELNRLHQQDVGAGLVPVGTPPPVAAAPTTPQMPASFDQSYVNQLIKEAAQQAGGTLSFADASNAARNLGIPVSMLTSPLITGAPRLLNMGGIASLGQGGYPRRTGQISGPGTEKSDSIPAMLSDGEFVMTAKAVRGAGKGSRRAGAKQMYKLMHQLEKNAERG